MLYPVGNRIVPVNGGGVNGRPKFAFRAVKLGLHASGGEVVVKFTSRKNGRGLVFADGFMGFVERLPFTEKLMMMIFIIY